MRAKEEELERERERERQGFATCNINSNSSQSNNIIQVLYRGWKEVDKPVVVVQVEVICTDRFVACAPRLDSLFSLPLSSAILLHIIMLYVLYALREEESEKRAWNAISQAPFHIPVDTIFILSVTFLHKVVLIIIIIIIIIIIMK